MVKMDRNLNLEEIETDAFMGIEFFKYQTLFQKIIFIGGFAVGLFLMLFFDFYLNVSTNIAMILMLPPIGCGVLLGCNYNRDLTFFKFLLLKYTRPVTRITNKKESDLEQIYKNLNKLEQETESQQNSKEEFEKKKKRLYKTLIIFFAVLFGGVIVLYFVANNVKNDDTVIHHTAYIYQTETQI